MAVDAVIQAEKLGKKYIIGHQSNESYSALRDVIARSARNFVRTAGDMLRGRPIYSGDELEEFWALDDVNFEIQRGDVVGIVGRNGAGKSTLLKILSRITEPSRGRVSIRGRVASLLEVGTGFHPELTGRENIHLNGAVLGMGRAEIKRKFDEIVEFAEVSRFLDTPVKRYSSGMYVRLAFAVAAHLEPEILIVDEVLAVGDIQFQEKCLGKMNSVAKSEGRTVLFVSHNMAAIQGLCSRGILLRNGTLSLTGSADAVVAEYIKNAGPDSVDTNRIRRTKGDGSVEVESAVVARLGSSEPITVFADIEILISLRCQVELNNVALGISIINEQGVLLTELNSVEGGVEVEKLGAGASQIKFVIRNVRYLPNGYLVKFWIMNSYGHIYFMSDYDIKFSIAPSRIYGNSDVNWRWGSVYSEIEFSTVAPA